MATKASKKKPTAPATNPQRDMFVIMPFSGTKSCSEEQWTDIFENVFSPAAEAAGLACSRARVSTGSLIKSIVERLRTSYIVLADITDANPNVFYELGVRHSLSKRTIIVAQGANHIPSDLRGYWSLVYGTGPGQVKKFANDLKDIVDQIDAEPEKPDSPVGDYLEREFVQGSRQLNLEVARKLSALHTELTGLQIEVGKSRHDLLQHDCLSLLLDTRYLDPGVDILALSYELRDCLKRYSLSPSDADYKERILALLMVVIEQLNELRVAVSKGAYAQPEQLSVMKWSTRIWLDAKGVPIHEPGMPIMLIGKAGSGKTCLVSSLMHANVLYDRGRAGLSELCARREPPQADGKDVVEDDSPLRQEP